MKEVKFPVVTFDKEEHVSYAKDEDDLSVCTKTSLDNGYYDYLLIIDIEGKQYIVEGVSRKQVLGYNIFLQRRKRPERKAGLREIGHRMLDEQGGRQERTEHLQ